MMKGRSQERKAHVAYETGRDGRGTLGAVRLIGDGAAGPRQRDPGAGGESTGERSTSAEKDSYRPRGPGRRRDRDTVTLIHPRRRLGALGRVRGRGPVRAVAVQGRIQAGSRLDLGGRRPGGRAGSGRAGPARAMRCVAELLRRAGWVVNDKRVERIWRREGLKVPAKQSKRRRLWLADGSCSRLRAEHSNHVWSYEFVEDRTHDGRKYRMLNIVDEFTRECMAIGVARRLRSMDVIELLAELFLVRGVPGYIRSDNGPEFVAKAVQGWLAAVGTRTAYITLGSPWENGYIESFNVRIRDELLDFIATRGLKAGAWNSCTNVVVGTLTWKMNSNGPCAASAERARNPPGLKAGSARNSNTWSTKTRRWPPSKSGKPSRVRTVKGKSG